MLGKIMATMATGTTVTTVQNVVIPVTRWVIYPVNVHKRGTMGIGTTRLAVTTAHKTNG